MEDVFKFKNLTYNFRNMETLNRSNVNSVKYGTETITSLVAKSWKILPNDYKELTSLSTLKSKNKNWQTDNCPCRLCKTYIQRVGFIWLGIVTSDQCLLNSIFFFFLNYCCCSLFVCCFCCCCCCCGFYYYYYYYYLFIFIFIYLFILLLFFNWYKL